MRKTTQAKGPSLVHLFTPGSIKGMNSKRAASALPDGFWPLLSNIRWDGDDIVIRQPITSLGATGLAGGAPRGGWEGFLSGTANSVIGTRVSGTDTRLHRSTNFTSYAEITAASGQYGNTRFQITSTRLFFQAVHDRRNSQDYLVVQNGLEFPRVYSPDTGLTVIHEPITPPGTQYKVVASFPQNVDLQDASNTDYATVAASGANLTMADASGPPTAPGNYIILSVTASVATNDHCTVKVSALDLSDSRQLVLGAESTYLNWWDNVAVQVSEDNSTYHTVFDPTTNEGSRVVAPQNDTSNRFLHGLALDHIASTSRNAVLYIRFVWMGATAPAANQSMNIYLIAGSGNAPGRRQHLISWGNSGSRAESAGVFVREVELAKFVDLGGTALSDARIPWDSKFYYSYSIYGQNTSTAEKDKGVDRIYVYTRDPVLIIDQNGQLREAMERRFVYTAQKAIAVYTSSWGFSSGSALSTISVADDTPSEERDITVEAPDAYHLPIPRGTAMEFANGRLIVATRITDALRASVMISEDGNPFRFREAAKFEDGNVVSTSPTSIMFPGENVQQFASVATSVLGANAVYIFTTQAIYVISGTNTFNLSIPTRISPRGTNDPLSVQEYKGIILFVDSERQLMKLQGGTITEVSRLLFDNILQAAGSNTMSSAVHSSRYYLAYSPSGGSSNTRCLVYNLVKDALEADDDMPGDVTADFLLGRFDTQRKLIIWGTDGSTPVLYQYEASSGSGDIGGSGVTVSLTTRELHDGMWESITVGKMGIVSSAVNASLTTAYTFKDQATRTDTATWNLNKTNTAWVWNKRANGNPPGGYGVTFQCAITGTLPSGTTILGIVAEIAHNSKGAAI